MPGVKEHKPKILIAGCTTDIISLKSIILKNISSSISIINSTSEAVEYIKANNIDLLLLDIEIPSEESENIFTSVKKFSPSTRVIVICAAQSPKKAVEYLNKGACDYLEKPFNKDIASARVRNVLAQIRADHEVKVLKKNYSLMESQYKYLVQNTGDIIYCLDDEGRFTFINDFAKKVLGYDAGQLVGEHYSSIVYPDFQNQAKYTFNERRTERRNNGYIRLGLKPCEAVGDAGVKNKKQCVTVQLKAMGLYEENGKTKEKKYLGTYGIARDISKFIDMEELFKLQSVYFLELFNNSPEAMIILDNHNRILDVNKSFEKLFKYSRDELIFNNIHDFIVPGDKLNEAETLSRTLIDKDMVEKEAIRLRKDGKSIKVSIYGYPIKYKDKNIGMYAVYRDLSRRNGSKEELRESLAKLRKAMGGIVHAMVSTVEVRDPYTAGHQERVSNLARAIAGEMNLSSDDIEGIRLAGTLHDLGKVNIPAEILSRPGQLTDIEFSLIKRHPEIAYKILQNMDTPWPIADIVYQHHERLDGSGYPRGLKGDEISLAARILTVADVVEAIASHRPYRPALGIDKALCEIEQNRGILYDERVVEACVKIIKEDRFVL